MFPGVVKIGGLAWIDAQTPKQGLLAAKLADKLREAGIDAVITCRDYDYTVDAIRRQGYEPVIIGRHGGGSLRGKLEADIERMKGLLAWASATKPGVLIAYPDPPAARVAFGLRIPYIALSDSPHSIPASRLSIPLAEVLIYSDLLPHGLMERYVLGEWTRVRLFHGVDQLLWIKGFKPDPGVLEELGVGPGYIVVRAEESKASYYEGRIDLVLLASRLASKGYPIIFLPRYHDQATRAADAGLRVLEKPVDGASLVYYASAVVTGGNTMAVEAALLGVPGITLFQGPLPLNEKLSSMGFPLYRARSLKEAEAMAEDFYRREVRVDTSSLLETLEDPGGIVIEESLRMLEGG